MNEESATAQERATARIVEAFHQWAGMRAMYPTHQSAFEAGARWMANTIAEAQSAEIAKAAPAAKGQA